MRTFLKSVLAGVAAACILAVPVLAEENTAFFEDFSNYTTGSKMTGGDATVGSWRPNNWGQENYLTSVTDAGGNKGINVIPTKSGEDYTNQFVFSKFRFTKPFPDEMVHVSFKIMGNNLDSAKNCYFDMNADTATNSNGMDFLYIGPNGIYEMLSGKKNGVQTETGVLYDVSFVIDIKNMKFYLYVDGELKADVVLPYNYSIGTTPQTLDNLYEIRFRWGGWVDWLDDFKISRLKSGDFKATVPIVDGNTITVKLNNSISAAATEEASAYKIANLLTGEKITPADVKVVKGMTDLLKLTIQEPLADATEYQLLLPDGFADVLGQTLKVPLSIETPGEGMFVKKLRFYDYQANEYTLAEEKLPAKINKIQLWFSNPLTVEKLTKENFELKTADGTFLEYTVTPGEGNTVLLSLSGYLFGDESYELKLADTVCTSPYTFEFQTAEGVFEVKSIAFIHNGAEVEELSTVTSGTLSVKCELVKTIQKPRSMVLSYSAWQGKIMKDFNYVNVEMIANETVKPYTVTVDNYSGMTAIKGFLWDSFTAMNAICDEIKLD